MSDAKGLEGYKARFDAHWVVVVVVVVSSQMARKSRLKSVALLGKCFHFGVTSEFYNYYKLPNRIRIYTNSIKCQPAQPGDRSSLLDIQYSAIPNDESLSKEGWYLRSKNMCAGTPKDRCRPMGINVLCFKRCVAI